MNYWIEKTYPSRRDIGTFTKYLSSPTASANGSDIYRRMREVEVDDIVFHLDQDSNQIIGYSEVANSHSVIRVNKQTEYNINLHNFQEFSNPIEVDAFLSDQKNQKLLDQIKRVEKQEVFYQLRNGRYYKREGGYLTPLDSRLAKRIDPNIPYSASHPGTDEDEDKFPEGKVKYRLHRTKERNGKLTKQVKENFKKTNGGKLFCQCCNFDFVKKYGDIGEDFIEAHHLIPIKDIDENHETSPKDIVLLCSNCHRMIHRHRPWIDSPKKLKKLLKKKKQP